MVFVDPINNAPSLLKLINDYDPIFLGEQLPYDQCLEIIDDDLSWVVRLNRNVSGPVLGDRFTKFGRDSGLKKNDYLLLKAIGASTFYVSVFKSCAFENSFISKLNMMIPLLFFRQNFKGGEATLYVGDRYWNVKMKGWSDRSAFTDGFSKLIEDLALDTRSTLLFTSVGYKTFEVSIFNHLTGTEIYFKKAEVVVLDDSIYGDEGFYLLTASKHKEKLQTNESHVEEGVARIVLVTFNFQILSLFLMYDTDDSKFNRHIAALIEMEDAKKLVKLPC
ncbi:putative transcription factor B3-Domain family [Helianthus debilis subsp. tardiflorus]